MQVITTRRIRFPAVFFLAMLLCQLAFAAPVLEKSALVKVVSDVYRRYAWVAVFSVKPPPESVPMAKASRRELGSIFVPELAQAIWNDAQCAKKRHEICIVDFDLLFDSQDPSANDLSVEPDVHSSAVLACFKEASGVRRCLSFIGESVGGTVKVADIVYYDKRSLRTLLGIAKKDSPKQDKATTRS